MSWRASTRLMTMDRSSNPRLKRLDVLVGEWEMQASIGEQAMAKSRTTFAWLEGGGFLAQHAEPGEAMSPEWEANSPLPLDTIMGLDDHTDTFSMLYADARGVCRVYKMSLEGGAWKIWGQPGPRFYQRFEGSFSEDGTLITARWESSADGETWTPDFSLTYTKVG
jgi:hypothetical protein